MTTMQCQSRKALTSMRNKCSIWHSLTEENWMAKPNSATQPQNPKENAIMDCFITKVFHPLASNLTIEMTSTSFDGNSPRAPWSPSGALLGCACSWRQKWWEPLGFPPDCNPQGMADLSTIPCWWLAGLQAGIHVLGLDVNEVLSARFTAQKPDGQHQSPALSSLAWCSHTSWKRWRQFSACLKASKGMILSLQRGSINLPSRLSSFSNMVLITSEMAQTQILTEMSWTLESWRQEASYPMTKLQTFDFKPQSVLRNCTSMSVWFQASNALIWCRSSTLAWKENFA